LNITAKNNKKIIESFAGKRIMIIGDAMLDAYWMGKVNRISPEAPVPVLDVQEKSYKPGGAANVALNIKSLGAIPLLYTILGDDNAGAKMIEILKQEGIKTNYCLLVKNRISTIKTRVLSQAHHILRIDEEQTDELKVKDKLTLQKLILKGINELKPHAIIIEDYDKGMLCQTLIEGIIEQASALKIPIAVDPKHKNFWYYKNVTLFKPNLRELSEAIGKNIDAHQQNSLLEADKFLRKKLNNNIALITLSEAGIFVSNKTSNYNLPAHVRNIADVSGAGDTVISVAALCLAVNANIKTLAALSNLAGGLVCEKRGVEPITKQQLLDECVRV
jgi:rfaE bifunctional protein kinase chain/domain